MADDMNIVVGVKVEAAEDDLKRQISKIKPQTPVAIQGELDLKATEKAISEKATQLTPPSVAIHGTVDATQLQQAVQDAIQRVQAPTVTIRAELDQNAATTIEHSLQQMVARLANNMPTLNLGNALLGGGIGGNNTQAQTQQTQQAQRAANRVAQTLRNLRAVQFDVSSESHTLADQLREFGIPEADVDAVVRQIERGGFKIAQARARFAQRVQTDDQGNRQLSDREMLQSVTIGGTTADGVSAVRTLNWNGATGEYAMSTQLGMVLNEQGQVVQKADQATKQQRKINKLLNELNELESQAFNRRQPIQGESGDLVSGIIDSIRSSVEGGNTDATQIQREIDALKTVIRDAKAAQRAVNELGNISVADKVEQARSSVQTRTESAQRLMGSLNADGLEQQAQRVSQALQTMQGAFDHADTQGANATSADWDAYTNAVKNYQEAVTQATNAQRQFNEQQRLVSTGNSLLGGLQDAGLTTQANQLAQALQRVQQTSQAWQNSADPNDLQAYSEAMKSLKDMVRDYNQELRQTTQSQAAMAQAEKQLQVIAKIRQEWSKAMKDTQNVQQLNSIEKMFQSGNVDQIKKANQQLRVFQATMKATGQATQTFASKLKTLVKEFTSWFSVSQIIMSSINAIKSMISDVSDIDASLTELKKVTDETSASYEKFSERAVRTAKNLKTSITDVIDATAGWSRLGYSMADAEALGEWSIIYANVGDDIASIDDATSSLISTLKGFGTEGNSTIDQVERIADIFNKLGNTTSISSGKLGESLQNSAAALSEANNTLTQSAALTVGAYDVLQNAAEVGNMWKTVSMRIRGAKTELQAAGEETDGMAESTSKLRAQVKAMTGFDIMANANEFKSTYDIIVGIGEVWETLSDVDQASLLELLAGKNRGNALAAALKNVDSIKEAYELAANSAGSAAAEYDVYADSVEAHANRLEASTQAFAQSVIATDIIKVGYDGASGILDVLTGISDLLGSMPSLITAAATAFTLFSGKGRSSVIYAPLMENPLAA